MFATVCPSSFSSFHFFELTSHSSPRGMLSMAVSSYYVSCSSVFFWSSFTSSGKISSVKFTFLIYSNIFWYMVLQRICSVVLRMVICLKVYYIHRLVFLFFISVFLRNFLFSEIIYLLMRILFRLFSAEIGRFFVFGLSRDGFSIRHVTVLKIIIVTWAQLQVHFLPVKLSVWSASLSAFFSPRQCCCRFLISSSCHFVGSSYYLV